MLFPAMDEAPGVKSGLIIPAVMEFRSMIAGIMSRHRHPSFAPLGSTRPEARPALPIEDHLWRLDTLDLETLQIRRRLR